MPNNKTPLNLLLVMLLVTVAACAAKPASPTTPTPPPLAKELVFYNWADYMPQDVLDAFTAEYGVKVKYVTYGSNEEAEAQIRAGKAFDVAVIDQDTVPSLVADSLLAEIDYRNLLNFKNISANFRDLATDPGNHHSVPYNFGTTGLVLRGDLVSTPITRWADLWDPRYAGKIALRQDQSTEVIGLTLLSLGYSLNTEEPAELEAALRRLLTLRPSIFFVDVKTNDAVSYLLDGKALILVGWARDALQARRENPAVRYIVPEDSPTLWLDTYVIAANSSNKYTAELFINFLLRPAISAQIASEGSYATANEAAYPFIKPEIARDRVIFPPEEVLKIAVFWRPHSVAGKRLYSDVWAKFVAAGK